MEFAFTDSDFRQITALIERHSGITLGEHKRSMVYSRLARRLRQLQLPDFRSYCHLIETSEGNEELTEFVNALTTNLTSFYRESHHFTHLSEWLKQVAATDPARIRIWSAGCSAGMEPYTIAITARECIDVDRYDFRILATDIDTQMLQKASTGIYSTEEGQKIPSHLRQRYFRQQQGQIAASEELKSLIAFKQLNLHPPHWPMKQHYQAIFCRNVIIYFTPEKRQELIGRFAQYLPAGAFLYIGHSETISRNNSAFHLVGNTIYQRTSV